MLHRGHNATRFRTRRWVRLRAWRLTTPRATEPRSLARPGTPPPWADMLNMLSRARQVRWSAMRTALRALARSAQRGWQQSMCAKESDAAPTGAHRSWDRIDGLIRALGTGSSPRCRDSTPRPPTHTPKQVDMLIMQSRGRRVKLRRAHLLTKCFGASLCASRRTLTARAAPAPIAPHAFASSSRQRTLPTAT